MDVFRAHRAVIHSISPQSLHTEYALSSSEKRPHSRWTENVPGNLKKREERRGEVRRGEERRRVFKKSPTKSQAVEDIFWATEMGTDLRVNSS
jgi:hypothetical protein